MVSSTGLFLRFLVKEWSCHEVLLRLEIDIFVRG